MERFVITIARSYGSGGKTIGKLLAQELGVNCYDRELLRLASDDSGINEELFLKADEKLKSSMLYKVARNVYKGGLIGPDSNDFTSTENLFNYQAKVLKELAEKESCVIIGRCADFILKDRPDVIRLFVHAPLGHCIEVVKDLQGLDEKEVEQKILKRDKYRAEYYKYHTGNDWIDARNYDLCLNTNEISFEKCIGIVKAYMAVRG